MISYNEPDNVTCSECGWAVHTPWHYLWKVDPDAKPPPPPPPPAPPPPAGKGIETCLAACCAVKSCVGFLYEAHSDSTAGGCKLGGECCWFKSVLKPAHTKPASVGAVRSHAICLCL